MLNNNIVCNIHNDFTRLAVNKMYLLVCNFVVVPDVCCLFFTELLIPAYNVATATFVAYLY